MAEFVNKVKKNDVEYEIRDARIADVDELKTDIAGNSLVIPEAAPQPLPEPVATIDGVDYYHKQEFDLSSFTAEDTNTVFNLLTGEQITDYIANTATMAISSYGPSYPTGSIVAYLTCGYRFSFNIAMIAEGSSVVPSIDYTSRAFTCVDTMEEVTENTDICLPTCSAYYGFISEDNKTFISYFNLKSDGSSVPEYVDSVKQGNAVIQMKDARVPASAVADAGKIVKVGEDGSYELAEGVSGESLPLYEYYNNNYPGTCTLNDLISIGAIGEDESVDNKHDFILNVTGYRNYVAFCHFRAPSSSGSGILQMRFGYGPYALTDILAYEEIVLSESNWKTTNVLGGNLVRIQQLPSDASSKTYALETSNNTIVWAEKQSGGGDDVIPIALTDYDFSSGHTYGGLANAIGVDLDSVESGDKVSKPFMVKNHPAIYLFSYYNFSSKSFKIVGIGPVSFSWFNGSDKDDVMVDSFETLPMLPSTKGAQSGTYTLKLVNGSLKWVQG